MAKRGRVTESERVIEREGMCDRESDQEMEKDRKITEDIERARERKERVFVTGRVPKSKRG